jgi:hypothetical protein
MTFKNQFFENHGFSQGNIRKFFENAEHDLAVVKESGNLSVIFTFSYNALLKLGIAVISSKGYRAIGF